MRGTGLYLSGLLLISFFGSLTGGAAVFYYMEKSYSPGVMLDAVINNDSLMDLAAKVDLLNNNMMLLKESLLTADDLQSLVKYTEYFNTSSLTDESQLELIILPAIQESSSSLDKAESNIEEVIQSIESSSVDFARLGESAHLSNLTAVEQKKLLGEITRKLNSGEINPQVFFNVSN